MRFTTAEILVTCYWVAVTLLTSAAAIETHDPNAILIGYGIGTALFAAMYGIAKSEP